ncbi:MAG: phosphohistidine phosphatase [Burkholderiales bacterium]|jgi:phosphohistidine phosphatase|nr:phosphohistidine phosphatase [Burkholderiales bacterium]
MDLILWRHADAEDGAPDLERRLTKKGRKQAARVADWLRKRLPQDFTLVSSPAARARETAEALEAELRIEKALAPGASVAAIVGAAGWPGGDGTVIIVGHQPDLGCALAYLLSGQDRGWRLQKGAFWWLESGEPVLVKAAVSPDLL